MLSSFEDRHFLHLIILGICGNFWALLLYNTSLALVPAYIYFQDVRLSWTGPRWKLKRERSPWSGKLLTYRYLGILEGRLPLAQVGPLRECRGPGVVHTDAPAPVPGIFQGYHHVRSVFFVSVLEPVLWGSHFYRGWYFIPFFISLLFWNLSDAQVSDDLTIWNIFRNVN